MKVKWKWRGPLWASRPETGPGWLSVPWLSALHVFVHPRTVDIDCAGDRLRHISTQLAPAAEKHINWLHWEPCLVTMAKHTGREGGGGGLRRGSGFSAQSLRGCLSQTLLSFPPATSVIFSLPFLNWHLLSLSPSLSSCLSTPHTYKHNLHISFFSCILALLIDADLINLPLPHTPPPYPTTLCNIICLSLICFFFSSSPFFPHVFSSIVNMVPLCGEAQERHEGAKTMR